MENHGATQISAANALHNVETYILSSKISLSEPVDIGEEVVRFDTRVVGFLLVITPL